MSNNKELDEIAKKIDSLLVEKDKAREKALALCRHIVRNSSEAIKAIHKKKNHEKALNKAISDAKKLSELLSDYPDLYYAGFVDNALQELAEAQCVYAISKKQPFPDPNEMAIPYACYLTGLGDTVGELRRFALDEMRIGNIDDAVQYLDTMEDIYAMLMRFDYPNAVLPIKHKQDLARNLIEKTRSEIAVAVRSKALEEKIERLERYLGTNDTKKADKADEKEIEKEN